MNKRTLLAFAFVAFGFVAFNTGTKIFAGSCTYVGAGGGNWNIGGNWSGTCVGAGGIPGTNDDITIPANTSTNNNIVGLTLNSITYDGSPSSTQSGNSVTILNGILSGGVAPNPITVSFNVILGADAQLATNNYSGGVNVGNHTLTAGGGARPWTISGPLSGTGTIIMNSVGAGAGLNNGGTFNGTIIVSGMSEVYLGPSFTNADVVVTTGATLNYTSSNVSSILTDGSGVVLRPFDGVLPGTIRSSGDIDIETNDIAAFYLVGPGTPGQDYDHITADTISIAGANLDLTLDPGYTPGGGDNFIIISAAVSITGTFAGHPDGSLVSVGGQDFIIHYTGTTVTLGAVGGQVVTDNPSFTSNPTTPTPGQSVTLTGVIGSNFQMPAGTAEFFDGATSLGTVTIAGGNAVITIPGGFSAGSHSITFIYSGDLVHGAFVSNPLVLNVAGLAATGINFPTGFILLGMIFILSGAFVFKKNI